MMRAAALLLLSWWIAAPALAQESQEIGQMRLYIQQLEERLRQLTGQNEQLSYELNQLRAQTGQGAIGQPGAAPQQTGAVPLQPAPAFQDGVAQAPAPEFGAPQDPGALSVAPDDPLISPDGGHAGAPVDLSVLAGGGLGADPSGGFGAPIQPALPGETQTAGLPSMPSAPTALSGSARDEYDLAYGYVLTGEYGLAEQSFQNWLASFPDDPQATDARFWLAESHFQQGEYRDAANTFLAVYKEAEQSPKGPDALLKLGMSLSALGEKNAACATLAEIGRKYPGSSPALMSRVDAETERAGC
jgi:tol-pal system protein YbgF